MAGAVFLGALVVAVLIICLVLFSWATAIPAAVAVLIVGLGVPFIMGLLRRAEGGGGDVPTTGEASYDPTPDPSDR